MISCRLCAPKNVCVSAMRVVVSDVGIRVAAEKKTVFSVWGMLCMCEGGVV